MNNNNVFYQLREQDNNVVSLDRVNGNYNVNLKRPLILNEGDELLLNKAIIDTRTLETDKIILVNDITIQFDISYYLINSSILSERNNVAKQFNANGGAPWGTGDLDYEPYILGVPTGTANPTDIFTLRQVRFDTPDTGLGKPPFNMQYFYINVEGIPSTVNVKVSLQDNPSTGAIFWISDVLSIATSKIKSFINTTDPNILYKNGIWQGFGKEVQTIDEDPQQLNTFTPFQTSIEVIINKGDYNYADFADRINQNITFINNNDVLTIENPGGDNKLLLNTNHPIYDALFKKDALWIRSIDGAKGFSLEPTDAGGNGAVYFGTNQFVLLFDDITNRFFFKYLNMPIYDGDSGNQAIKFENLSGDNIKLVNKSSGILINSITTKDNITGLNIDLFSEKLGFNVSSLQPNYDTVNNTTLLGTNARSFKCNLNDGINITGGLSSLDILLRKKAPAPTPPATVQEDLYKEVPNLPGLGNILTDQQNEIYADNAVGLGSALLFGYYVIAIDGLQGDFITRNDIYNNIFAIISRYYSSNNYTVGSPEDAIIYTHRGKPQILNNLNVRILNGDFRFITNLGTDNTLFLQHRKARVPLDMIQQLEQEEEEKKKG